MNLRRSFTLTVVLATAVVLAGCSDDEPDAAAASDDPYGAAYDALCQAAEAAAEGDAADAERLFFDRAHQALHELTPDVAEVDRADAARLLEAKEDPEATLRAEDDPSDELAVLTTATRNALQAIDRPAPTCPEGS